MAILNGTTGKDTITGTSKSDIINGLAGDDTIKAGDSNDTITGGAGNDDKDGSETLRVTVAGVPIGATLSAGTNNGNGTWTLNSTQLSGLTIKPPLNSDAAFTLTVTATSTESNGGNTASTVAPLAVKVTG